jgi:Helix-turn-helix domain
MDNWLMGEEAAQYLGVSRQRLHQLTQEGVGRKVSGHWIFTREELDQYRASEKNKGGRPKDDANQTMENRTPAGVAV